MQSIHRRHFVQLGAAAFAGAALGKFATPALAAPKRKMTIDLVCGRIGVKATQAEAIAYAARYGFESVEPNLAYLAEASPAEMDQTLGELKAENLVWGASGLPVNFRGDDQKFRQGLADLKGTAPALQRAGVTRIGTWLTPCDDVLDYKSNFRQHAERLREIAKILRDNGIRLGLEYVGPKTSWSAKRYPFIHTMAQMKTLIAEIGLDNVGLVLDTWHWYTAHETKADLQTLTNKDIVAVDLNDAPLGRAVDEQLDGQRELPAATGVIDVGTFLSALNALGCDAPVRAAVQRRVKKMPPDQALAATAAAMKKAFGLIR